MQQLLINILIVAAEIALVAFGFGIIFRVARVLHFGHGAVFTAGAYFTFLSCTGLNVSLGASIVFGVVMSTVLGCSINLCVFQPLCRKGASAMTLLLLSLGLYVVLQNMISMAFGDVTRSLRVQTVELGVALGSARITHTQLATVCVAVITALGLTLFLTRTGLGRVVRAVADDPQLATALGVNVERVVMTTFAIGSSLAGIAGILVALDVDMTPTMGLMPLMFGVVAVIVGGIVSISGVVIASLLVAAAQQTAAWVFGSQWQDCSAFIVLIIFLCFRPQGFLGQSVKKATV